MEPRTGLARVAARSSPHARPLRGEQGPGGGEKNAPPTKTQRSSSAASSSPRRIIWGFFLETNLGCMGWVLQTRVHSMQLARQKPEFNRIFVDEMGQDS